MKYSDYLKYPQLWGAFECRSYTSGREVRLVGVAGLAEV
jgi:hypothetical protein